MNCELVTMVLRGRGQYSRGNGRPKLLTSSTTAVRRRFCNTIAAAIIEGTTYTTRQKCPSWTILLHRPDPSPWNRMKSNERASDADGECIYQFAGAI